MAAVRVLPGIRTSRVELRPIAGNDVRALASLLRAPEVLKWMPSLGTSLSIDDAVTLLETSMSGFTLSMTLDCVAVRRSDGALLGQVTLPSLDGELQYWLGLPFWGQGYASEIVNAVMNLLRSNNAAGSTFACVHRDNLASQRVLEKARFRFTGLRWRTFACQRGLVPVLEYRHYCECIA